MVRIDNIDEKQGKAIGYLVAISIILSGVVGVLAYLQSKKHAKINEEVLNLDKEIKVLELAIKTNQAKDNGVV
jgi:TRAP-type mannitol/chloroaromatic compound transport system permease small subunit